MKHKILIAIFFIALSTTSYAQVNKIQIQAAGLTCSMCSKAIYTALGDIDFVKDVKSDIKTSSFIIHLKNSNKYNFDKLQKAVDDAGFSVAKFTIVYQFNNIKIENDTHYTNNGTTFHFMNVKPQVLNGEVSINIIDKGYVTAKDYKANSKYTKMKCYETGVMESCCSNNGHKASERIFHVTLNK
ncbi:MAG: cation transporter [Chitinophagaceae bacterium]|nr:cation transporter [Chitinophagaceae bacterium]